MNPDQTREETLFSAARALTDPKERAVFLEAACQGDPELRRGVEALLAAQAKGNAYFDRGAQDPGLGATRKDPDRSASAGLAQHEKPGDRIGRYKLRERIGEGGCGIVYVAEQEEPVRRRVALKVIKLGMDTRQVVARFEAERQALAMMDHPNIAKVLDAGATESGRPYFVMELVRGIRITDYCDQSKLSTRQRLDLFVLVCNAVQHAHQKGIIHRDLKPSNVLVTLHDGVPVPKVIDFGIAKATEGRLTDLTVYTELHQFIGTPAYMSPEQAEMSGLDIDTRSDIYSLGVLLYELLTGRTPFDAKELFAAGLDEMRRMIRETEPVRPSTRLSTLVEGDLTTVAKARASEPPRLVNLIRGDLDWIVMKALEKDRTRRYETANGLAADLKRHLSNEPIVARPPSTLYRFQKLVRRNKLGFAAAAVVMTALILGVVTTSWQAFRATRAEQKVQKSLELESQSRTRAESATERAETAQRETARLLAESQRNAYYANLNLVQADWEQNNLARVWQSLTETRDYADRGFEWYYWQREMHRDVRTLRGHLDRVESVAISPDGLLIATSSIDRTAKVWELATGREVSTFFGHGDWDRAVTYGDWVRAVAFLPDSQRVVSCGNDGTVQIWEAKTGREPQVLERGTNAVFSVAVSKGTPRIVSGSEAGTVTVWDIDTGRKLHTLQMPTYVGWGVWGVDISSDGHCVVAGSHDGKVHLWDLRQGEVPLHRLPHSPGDHGAGDDQGIWSVAFSPDGKKIVSACGDGTVKLWDALTGQLLRPLAGPGNRVFCARFSPDGRRIATGSRGGSVRVWAGDTGEELQSVKGHRSSVSSAVFANANTLVTGAAEGDHTTKVWDLATASGPLTLTNGPGVWSVAFSTNGQWLATGGDDGTTRIWNIINGNLERRFPGHTSAVYSVAFSPEGQRLATGSADGTARIWDMNGEGRPLVLKHSAAVNSVAFSPDGRSVATASADKTVKVWEALTGQELVTFTNHAASVRAVAFSPRGDWIVSAGEEEPTSWPKIWHPSNGRELQQLADHTSPGFAMGPTLATPDRNRWIVSLAVSPNGRRIAATRWLGSAHPVWDATTGDHLVDLKVHTTDLWSIAFSPGGQRLVTGSSDTLVRVWDASSGREMLTLQGHKRAVRSVAFSPDGSRIASGSLDGTAKIWTAATAEQVAVWEKEEAAAEQELEALRRARLAGKP